MLSIFPQESLWGDLSTTARVRVGCCHCMGRTEVSHATARVREGRCHWVGRTEASHFWSKLISVLENELITSYLLSTLLAAN